MDKYDFLKALENDADFRNDVRRLLFNEGDTKPKDSTTNEVLPFERDLAMEDKKIENALAYVDLNTLRKLVIVLPELSEEMKEIFGNNTYLTQPDKVKEDLKKQLEDCFGLLENYPDGVMFRRGDAVHAYSCTIEGAFYTEAGYYVDLNTHKAEPFVNIKFSPIESLDI